MDEKVDWEKVVEALKGLPTDIKHKLHVRREAIPIIFVPGIMGTCLRHAATGETRWNPSSKVWMAKHYLFSDPAERKNMLIGSGPFDPGYLEPDDHPSGPGRWVGDRTKAVVDAIKNPIFGSSPAEPTGVGDELDAIRDTYHGFLERLRENDWGPLKKLFVFPVYAFPYNWTDCNKNSGEKLRVRIRMVIAEANGVVGRCRKVILVTHSMGGLVARAAMKLGADNDVLGVVHGVQPVNGAPAAYWRIKGGFEESGAASIVLGDTGPKVTAVLANSPGGLELLPNALYRGPRGAAWLRTSDGDLPARSDPYSEIYAVPADPGMNRRPDARYWGLVDPRSLDRFDGFSPPLVLSGDGVARLAIPVPGRQEPEIRQTGSNDALDAMEPRGPTRWREFTDLLKKAQEFHSWLAEYQHPRTFTFAGDQEPTAAQVEFRIVPFSPNQHDETYRILTESGQPLPWGYEPQVTYYPSQGYRAATATISGRIQVAELVHPSQKSGDGTVPDSSAKALAWRVPAVDGLPPPFQAHRVFHGLKHEPAFSDYPLASDFALKAIYAMCQHYILRKGAV